MLGRESDSRSNKGFFIPPPGKGFNSCPGALRAIIIPIGERYPYSGGPMVEVANGRWMVEFETWNAYDDPSSMTTRLFALFSSDQGRTWDIEHLLRREQRRHPLDETGAGAGRV